MSATNMTGRTPGWRSEVLDRLLDEDLATDPVRRDGLSNHRPMALVALAALGADEARLIALAADYDSALVPCREHIAASTDRFTDEIRGDGVTAVLDRTLPGLVDGVGGAAFHGLIRLGYGLEHGRPQDVAGGLAFSVDATQPVVCEPVQRDADDDLLEVLDHLRRDPVLGQRTFASSGFSARFAEVAADPIFLGHLAGLSAEACSLATIASTTHALYRSTGDFFALHTVTATHAARLVTEHLSDAEVSAALAVGLARAAAVAYVVIGAPAIAPRPAVDAPPDWADIADATRVSDDPHVLKMVYTCRCEQAAWGGLDYQVTAAEMAGLHGG